MCFVGIATFTAAVVMLVRTKRVLHHSSLPPPPGTDHYEMVDEGEKSARTHRQMDTLNTIRT